MNLILFEPEEIERPLPRQDRRAIHVLDVLRRSAGDAFDAGVIDGARGKATLTRVTPQALEFRFDAVAPPVSDDGEPIALLVGLPRPQTARDILRDATALGVRAIHFVATEKSEPGYAQSTLWSSGEWRRHLLLGAEQAFTTRLPALRHGESLERTLGELSSTPATRLALDNYEAARPLSRCAIAEGSALVLAIGSERGWSAADRAVLRAHGFDFAHLGPRVLRTETACTAALAIARSLLGLM